MKLLTTKGKLELILEDDDMMATLNERWTDAEVAKQLDYPIFMAVSERGGKNNSGDYEYLIKLLETEQEYEFKDRRTDIYDALREILKTDMQKEGA